ncbi:S-phase kinase-associated protein [Trema orientale]|uniref:S-phase kinase-associated protein n=1 Tax=Trema orientale TaxID=63057 RepID=A0A2P5EX53_TREOI|nr:S-phase kinase-associated protein [Trema orientale]
MRKEDMVKLISTDGFEFVVHKDAAMVSQTIRNMLTSPELFEEGYEFRVLGFERGLILDLDWIGRKFRRNATWGGDIP